MTYDEAAERFASTVYGKTMDQFGQQQAEVDASKLAELCSTGRNVDGYINGLSDKQLSYLVDYLNV